MSKPKKKQIRAVGYCRVSTDEQAQEGLSLEYQQSRIHAYAASQDWQLTEIYTDAGYSGKNGHRPEYQRMIDDLKAGNAEILIVLKVDRITRKQRELLNLLEGILEPAGIGFKSVQEPFDTSTGMGKAFLSMVSVFAQLEGDMISERTRDVLQNKRKNGEWVGRVPFGFKVVDNHLIEHPEQKRIIKKIKQLRSRGKTIKTISEQVLLPKSTVFDIVKTHQNKRKAKYLNGNSK